VTKKSIILVVSDHKPKRKHLSEKPVADVLPSSYRPTKAELEEEVNIDATPEELARALTRDVTIRKRTAGKGRITG